MSERNKKMPRHHWTSPVNWSRSDGERCENCGAQRVPVSASVASAGWRYLKAGSTSASRGTKKPPPCVPAKPPAAPEKPTAPTTIDLLTEPHLLRLMGEYWSASVLRWVHPSQDLAARNVVSLLSRRYRRLPREVRQAALKAEHVEVPDDTEQRIAAAVAAEREACAAVALDYAQERRGQADAINDDPEAQREVYSRAVAAERLAGLIRARAPKEHA